MKQKTKLSLANPRGFCAGVDRAIEIVNRALDMFGSPIYVKPVSYTHLTLPTTPYV